MNTKYEGPNSPNWTNGRVEATAVASVAGGVAGWAGSVEMLMHTWGPGWIGWGQLWWYLAQDELVLPTHPVWLGYLPSLGFVLGGAVFAGLAWLLFTRPSEHHIRGYVLRRGPRRIARALRPRRKDSGIRVHPDVRISEELETHHSLLLGGSGSGKTTILWSWLRQIIARGDKVCLFDYKGDFTSCLDAPHALLAPWDQRSARWIVGRDIRTQLDAEALAATLIPMPNYGEKIWARGARGLLIGLIARLQRQHGENWGMVSLAEISARALANYDLLCQIVAEEHPPAKAFLMGADSKTTASFIAELAGALSDVINLGVAAHSMPKNPAWNVQDWLAGKLPRVAIIGHRARSPELSSAWASSIAEQITLSLLSLPDCHPQERRTWLIIDEVAQAGKIPSITTALTAARSKGARVVLGLQSIGQLRSLYDRDTATTWAGQTGIKIVCGLSAPDDQKWAADLVGEREVERFQPQSTRDHGSLQARQHASSWTRVREPVVMASDFGRELRVVPRRGPRALLLGGGEAAILDWPFPQLTKRRPNRTEAAWVLPGYQRPNWGSVPPRTATPPEAPVASSTIGHALPPPNQPLPTTQLAERPTAAKTTAEIGKASEAAADQTIDHLIIEPLADTIVPGAGLAASLLKTILGAGTADGGAIPISPAPISPLAASNAAPRDKTDENDRENEGQQ